MSNVVEEKVLVLMRHAKAETGLGKSDHDRELTARGRRDAGAAAEWLRGEGIVPDLVVCSTAMRTRQTWEAARTGGVNAPYVEYRSCVYQGGPADVVEALREDAGEMGTVLVVGHNPTMAQLTSLLSDGDGSRQAHDALGDGFSTSGVAVLRYQGSWENLAFGACVLDRFHVGRG